MTIREPVLFPPILALLPKAILPKGGSLESGRRDQVRHPPRRRISQQRHRVKTPVEPITWGTEKALSFSLGLESEHMTRRPLFSDYSRSIVKGLTVILLALVILLVGLPLAMGMGDMAPCPSCTDGTAVGTAMCLAMLAFFVLVTSTKSRVIGSGDWRPRRLLLADVVYRPPRVA